MSAGEATAPADTSDGSNEADLPPDGPHGKVSAARGPTLYLFVRVLVCAHATYTKGRGPFSVARLKMGLPLHDRLACNLVVIGGGAYIATATIREDPKTL